MKLAVFDVSLVCVSICIVDVHFAVGEGIGEVSGAGEMMGVIINTLSVDFALKELPLVGRMGKFVSCFSVNICLEKLAVDFLIGFEIVILNFSCKLPF